MQTAGTLKIEDLRAFQLETVSIVFGEHSLRLPLIDGILDSAQRIPKLFPMGILCAK